MSIKVLLLEDDRELGKALRHALTLEGYVVQRAASLSEARALWMYQTAEQAPDIHLLDLGLPDGDGQTWLSEVRQRSTAPVIVISARPEDTSKIRLLDAGADDYLVKPFSAAELLARMRVALRHRGQHARPAILVYQKQALRVDIAARVVMLDDQEIKLTPTEFELLARLVRSAGQAVSHRQLLQDVWGPEYLEHTHYTRLYIGQLRAKLESNPAQPDFILTETGVGYRLAEPDQS